MAIPSLEDAVLRFVGATIWASNYDPRSGILVRMGEKIPRRVPVLNPHLTRDEQYYDGYSTILTGGFRILVDMESTTKEQDAPRIVGATVLGAKFRGMEAGFDLELDGGRAFLVRPRRQTILRFSVHHGPEWWRVWADGSVEYGDERAD